MRFKRGRTGFVHQVQAVVSPMAIRLSVEKSALGKKWTETFILIFDTPAEKEQLIKQLTESEAK